MTPPPTTSHTIAAPYVIYVAYVAVPGNVLRVWRTGGRRRPVVRHTCLTHTAAAAAAEEAASTHTYHCRHLEPPLHSTLRSVLMAFNDISRMFFNGAPGAVPAPPGTSCRLTASCLCSVLGEPLVSVLSPTLKETVGASQGKSVGAIVQQIHLILSGKFHV